MMPSKKKLLVAAIAASFPVVTQAAGPTLGDVFKNTGITATGYVDASYTYLSGTGTFSDTNSTANRVYDRQRNSFNLHAVDIAIGYQPAQGFGAFVQLDMGSDANVSASTGTGSSDEFDVQEAYVQYAGGPVTVIAGKFATLAGAEVIEAPANLNFSRSILYGYAIPFTHTGVRASFGIGEMAKVHVGVNNGWDVFQTSATAPSDGKTIELGVALTPIKPLSISLAGYAGDALVGTANAAGSYGAPRLLVDLVATYNLTDDISFTLNADVGRQEDAMGVGQDAEWSGIAAYANWKFAKQWRVALRAEQFDDKDGFRTGINAGTGGQKWTEATATLAFLPTDNAEIRLEGRVDKSDFATAFNQTDGTTDDTQHSVAVQGIFKF